MHVTTQQWAAMEAMLANDEASGDDELTNHFVTAVGVTIEIAQFAMTYREDFLNADPNAAEQPSLAALWSGASIAGESRAERCLSPGYGS